VILDTRVHTNIDTNLLRYLPTPTTPDVKTSIPDFMEIPNQIAT
jgi:hypothetical protein